MLESEIKDLREKYPHLSDDFIAVLSADGEHALFGASYGHTWMHCSGAIQAGYNVRSHNTFYTIEGSAAHHWAEKARLGEFDLDLGIGDEYVDYITTDNDKPGSKGAEVVIELTEEMVKYINVFLEYCDLFIDDNCIVLCEKRIDYSAFVPNGFGTGDMIIYNKKLKKLYVIDLKYGQGVMVNAEENDQGLIYATGIFDALSVEYDIEEIQVSICQPRLDHISEATYTAEYLNSYAAKMAKAAHESLVENPTFTPGEGQCQFCRITGNCKAQAEYVLKNALEDFDDLDDLDTSEGVETKNLGVLTNEQLGKIGQIIPILTKFAEKAKAQVVSKLQAGEDLEGVKLIAGNKIQFWKNEDAALEMLKRSKLKADEYAPRSMLTVPQMRDQFPNHAVLKEFADVKQGNDKLVLISAKGDDLYREQFDDLDDDDEDFSFLE